MRTTLKVEAIQFRVNLSLDKKEFQLFTDVIANQMSIIEDLGKRYPGYWDSRRRGAAANLLTDLYNAIKKVPQCT